MRILVLSNFYPPHFIGGYELGCRKIVEALRGRGHELLVLTSTHGTTHQTPPESGVRRRFLPYQGKRRQNPRITGKHNLRAFRKAMREFKPELIYAWNMQHLGAPLLAAIEAGTVPRAYYLSDLWLTRVGCEESEWFERESKRGFGRRVKSRFEYAISFAAKLFGNRTPGRFRNLQCCSHFVLEKVQSLGLAAGDCEVIHWGVQSEKFIGPRRQEKSPSRLLYAGQLERHKGVHTAIRAFTEIEKTIPHATLTIAGATGDPGYLGELQRLARETTAISFIEKVPEDEMRDLYHSHDVLLFPSEWDEPFAITPLEAMAAGLAVVATVTGGSHEIFKDGVNCVIFTPGDPSDCVRQVVQLLRDPVRLARIARAGQDEVAKKFALEDMVDRIEEHLKRVSAARRNFVVFIAATHTASSGARTGIQTVVRGLLWGFGKIRTEFHVVRWPKWGKRLRSLDPEQSARLGIPHRRELFSCDDLNGAWLLLPELMYRRREHRLIKYARKRKMRIAAIFHDAIPVTHPEFVRREAAKYHAAYMKVLSQVDLLIAVSNSAAEQFSRFLHEQRLHPPPIHVCSHPGEVVGETRPAPKNPSSTDAIHILCVSTLEPRKNHETLLTAFEQASRVAARPQLFLHLVGDRYKDADYIAAIVEQTVARNPNVTWHGSVDERALAHLYDECDFTVYPSVLEGFGLPIIESLWRWRPCICANFGAMAETAAGGGCFTIDVRDPAKLANAMIDLATHPERRRRLVDEIEHRHVKTWSDYTTEIREVLEAADR